MGQLNFKKNPQKADFFINSDDILVWFTMGCKFNP